MFYSILISLGEISGNFVKFRSKCNNYNYLALKKKELYNNFLMQFSIDSFQIKNYVVEKIQLPCKYMESSEMDSGTHQLRCDKRTTRHSHSHKRRSPSEFRLEDARRGKRHQ